MGERANPGDGDGNLLGRKAELRSLAPDIDLEQHPDGHRGALRNVPGEPEGIDAMDYIEKREGVADFVGLKVADQVPCGCRRAAGEAVFRGPRFLDGVFADIAE